MKTDTFEQDLRGGIIPWAYQEDNHPLSLPQPPLSKRLVQVEAFIQNLDACIDYYAAEDELDEPCSGCYVGATDTIYIPYPVTFFTPENKRAIINYYSVLFHEIGHWTRHPQRLNRKGGHPFGTKAYALEELTAELTSAFVMNRLQVTESPILDGAEYLSKWQTVIAIFGGDSFSITTAELQAGKACDYLFHLQPAPF